MAQPDGVFSWADISLPDVAEGRRFYEQLFGWSGTDQHDPDGNLIYVEFAKDGARSAGMGPQPPAMTSGDIPPMWTSYVAVDSADDTVEKADRAGGSVLVGPMDVFDAGRMAMLADPGGAVFGLWQAGTHHGADRFNEPGFVTWNELATRDVSGARAFYEAVFGWRYDDIEAGGVPYAMAKVGDRPNGGIMAMDENWPEAVPPHWMVYFNVVDTDEVVRRIEELGGSVSVPPFDSTAGRIAVVADSQGGTFSIIDPTRATPS